MDKKTKRGLIKWKGTLLKLSVSLEQDLWEHKLGFMVLPNLWLLKSSAAIKRAIMYDLSNIILLAADKLTESIKMKQFGQVGTGYST